MTTYSHLSQAVPVVLGYLLSTVSLSFQSGLVWKINYMVALRLWPVWGKEAQGIRTTDGGGAKAGVAGRDRTMWALKPAEGVHFLS